MLETQNKSWGFWGTLNTRFGEDFAKKAWNVAMRTVCKKTGWQEEKARDFLDSRLGRHYADTVEGKSWQKDIKGYRWLDFECRRFASGRYGFGEC